MLLTLSIQFKRSVYVNPLTLLAIDDDKSIHSVFQDAVSSTRYAKHIQFISAYDGELGLKCLNYQPIDVSFVDFKLPKISGLDILKEQTEKASATDFIMISGQRTIENAVEAFKLGAKDFILKPFDYPDLKSHIERLFEDHQVDTKPFGGKGTALRSLIGESPSMIKLHRQIEKVAQSDLSVLILGESGTGKELIARAVHDSSKRANKPFIAINCGAIPRELIESELFGHEKGAFTGAVSKKIGCFQQADGGTLFLDEIGDLDFDLQVKLLRVLQEDEIRPVGTHKKVKIDLRIISATHRDLESHMAKQLFREDLYFRLNVFPIHAPALRDKVRDIPLLAHHFLEKIHQRYGGQKR
ncbi:MAG TPA: sigma-54-dependent Fis family transcriptional regulator, partial [Spirochaetes bacterium]|nr:sigma-54-dependent Fis family transcriptional regulator [Spirochaetota bacterium]